MNTIDEKGKKDIVNKNKNDNDFYNYDDYKEKVQNKVPSNKGKKIVFIVILVIVLIVLILLVIKSCDKEEPTKPNINVVLTVEKLELKVGNSQKIDYNVINSEIPIEVTWLSSDDKTVTVTEDGTVTAVKVGNATITASYFINETPYEKHCDITVIKADDIEIKDNEKPTLKYTMTGGKNNEWTKETVTIKVEATDNSGKVDVKYALNCTDKCKYINITNNTIKISENGTNIVTIVASDENNNSTKQTVKVKIDKEKPVCMLNIKDEITGEITAENTDNNGSGISYYGFSSTYKGTNEQQKIVKEGKHTYYVKDNAGNTNTCTINVVTKTQYRYQDCTACKACAGAGCAWQLDYWKSAGKKINARAE